MEEEKREEKRDEKARERIRLIGEYAKRIARGLEETTERFAKKDIPGFTKNVMILTIGGMTLYVMGVCLSTMMPQAVPVFAQFGRMLGFLVPLMYMFMIITLAVALAKIIL